jgi:predicted methyltransferase
MLDRRLIAFTLALALPLTAAPATPADVAAAVAGEGRSERARAADPERRPVEVLTWLGLEQGDHVLDYFTGGGYYSDIIARAVGPEGRVTGWNPAGMASNEEVNAAFQRLSARSPNFSYVTSPVTELSFPAESFDFVLFHLAYHDTYWESAEFDFPRIDPAIVTRAVFAATKPGGIVAVVDHVAPPGGDTRAVVEATHRIDPAVVRADFERAGFVFDGESDLLRNPQDDHGKGVFDEAVRGRTDRFIYRFRRP